MFHGLSYLFGKMMTAKQKICLYQWISQLSNNKQTEKKACYNSDFGDISESNWITKLPEIAQKRRAELLKK